MQQYTDEYRSKLLAETGVAFNSMAVIEKLKQGVNRNDVVPQENKHNRKKRDNEQIDYISKILFDYCYKDYFWEEVIELILDDMQIYKFVKISSVNYLQTFRIPEMTRCYSEVTLLEHTYNIVKQFVIAKDIPFVSRFNPFIVLLCCVLHDYGKCFEIKKMVSYKATSRDLPKHEEYSGLYVEKIANMIYEKYGRKLNTDEYYVTHFQNLKTIRTVVENHHAKEMQSDSLEYVVSKLDQATRKSEWENYIENGSKEKIEKTETNAQSKLEFKE